jgi:hypothetical protein
VLGVELNPILVRLLTGRFAEFAGLKGRSNVTIVADEARSYLSRHDQDCTFLQMSLVDTWAATAAGAFSLSENALYTLEAFRLFLERLTPDGLLSVTRWAHEYETGRLVSLAVTALFESGIGRPREHIAVLQAGSVATLLVSKAPFTRSDVGRLAAVAERLRFGVWVVPGSSSRSVLFEAILSAPSRGELEVRLDGYPMNLIAPTDEDPYFFNLLKLSSWNHPTSEEHWAVKGNMRASQMLLTLIGVQTALVFATVLVPLVRTAPGRPHFAKDRRFAAGAVYFSAIGAGFMFVEIGLIQKFNVYLGHPIYSLAVLLFTLILGAGVGSLASERIPVEAGGRWLYFPLVIAATVLIYRFASDGLIAATITRPMGLKIPLTVSLLFPVGVLMGLCFPLGMRLSGEQGAPYTPWFWALNGIFGVLSSSLAVLVSIYAGISTSLYIGAGCYLLLSVCVPFLAGHRARDAVGDV